MTSTIVRARGSNSAGTTTVLQDLSPLLTFHSEIAHGTYLHAFRIYKDKDSGCVRFEATPRRGPLKAVPIWTAFVTQFIGHRSWMKRVGAATVSFKEFHPYVFCEGYRLPKGQTGRYQLSFSNPDGKLSPYTVDTSIELTIRRLQKLHGHVPSHQTSTLMGQSQNAMRRMDMMYDLTTKRLYDSMSNDDTMRAVSAFA